MGRKIVGVAMAGVFIGIVFSSGVWATALPPEVMSSLKEVKILEVTKDNVDVIWDLRPNQDPDRADIVDLRLDYRDISTELSLVLQEWVSSGKGVILYQSTVKEEYIITCHLNNPLSIAQMYSTSVKLTHRPILAALDLITTGGFLGRMRKEHKTKGSW